ncbi:MAG: hypothetical protein CO120_04205 [Gammaproteobacteria bacterium CG_4_9_14_3_um_filter_38_9]|nr:MAG: hypothetical protein CO120_04205 [Gammaproteobacteria bacterium CG_4_9_14_3_um_filter_38_9]
MFCIENIIPNADAKKPPFNISAGTPFSCNKLIHTGLSLLQLCITPLPIQQLAALLQSPYLCPTEEDACIGAQLDALLREKNQLQVGLLDLYNTIPLLSSRYKNNTHLLRWRTLLQFSREKKAIPLKPSMWAHEFIHLLKSMQWPGERTQTTEEFQALEKFKKILFEFSKLDFIFDEIKLAKAFQLLQSQVQQTIFQAKSHDEPIQIMGTLEASSILFDAVWIMGLHDAIWPAATQPHPLIPYAIQQQYQMPHATAERELQFCERMTKRLMQSAKQVIFSSPAKTGDQLLFPSRLIQSVPFTSSDAFINKNENTLAEQILAKKQLETVSDDNTIPIHDFSMIRGGSHILKLQALCPYQAFAKIRLQAKPLNEPTLGIAAMIKGVIIHQVLFEIWDNIKDQMTLKKMDQNALNKLIVDKIDKAITENIAPSNAKHQHALIAVEKKRLQLLIQDWLKIEKSRPDFRVHSLETACQISINALPLKLRLDRVDELADGSLLLIDYKSGKNEIKNLLQERLTDPQLPLYAAYQNKNEPAYQGVAFAEIRNAKMSYQGITHENRKEQKTNTFQLIPIQDTKNDLRITQWETAIESWKKSLEATADDFCRGKITIDPIQKVTCDHCGLQSVCRYNIAESITEKQ